LDSDLIDLGTSWQPFSIEFTTTGFSDTTSDVRLRFWFSGPARDKDIFWIDDVRLEEIVAADSQPLWNLITDFFADLLSK
jgi:hypothetical protein